MSLVVSDTTPLNYLILIGQANVLASLFGKILVPPAVIREMRHPKAPAIVSSWTENLPSWIEVRTPRTDLHLGIGAGEDEAISLAVELGDAAVLVDDQKARAAAGERGLVTFGTIAVLDLADETGLLDFEMALSELLATTFHIEDAVLKSARDKVRERKKV